MPSPDTSPRALAILRRVDAGLLAALGIGVAVGLYSLACFIGAPILAYLLSRLVHALLVAARGSTALQQPRWTGAVAAVGVLLHTFVVVLAVAGAVYVSRPESTFAAFAIGAPAALLVSAVLGAQLAPLALTAFVLGDGETSPARALARSFELGARLGASRLARLGANVGLRLAAGPVVLSAIAIAVSRDSTLGAVVLAAPAGLALAIPFAGALLAREYVALDGEHERPSEAAVPRLRAIAFLLAPGVLVCAATLMVAALAPVPMRELALGDPGPDELRGWYEPGDLRPVRLPGTTVTVYPAARGVRVEADDGGGAGEIDARFAIDQIVVVPGGPNSEPPGTFAVFATTGTDVAFTIVDADGVRLDDGLEQRVVDRLGTGGIALLGLSVLFVLLLLLVLARDVGAARTLDAPSLADARGRAGLAVLECVLRTGGRMFFTSSGMLVAEEDAWLEADGGAVRLRLPPEASIIGSSRAPEDGDPIALVSRFERPIVAGMREAAAWPADARLVIGTRADAAEALVSRAARRATWLAVPALGCMLAASILVLIGL